MAERTQELLRSNEALRQSNDDLNQFAYAASHDLQEPLRMVALYSQMLQRKYFGKLDANADQYISYMVGGAQRMEMLLKDLLTYSQTGSSAEGPAETVDFIDVIRKVLLNLQASVEQSGAMITWDALPAVHAHEIRLVQLLQNLVGNAIKYRSEDPPRIHISRRNGGNPNGCCRCRTTASESRPSTRSRSSRSSSACMGRIIREPASAWRFASESWKPTAGGSGWSRSRKRVVLLLHAASGQGPGAGGAGGNGNRAGVLTGFDDAFMERRGFLTPLLLVLAPRLLAAHPSVAHVRRVLRRLTFGTWPAQ